jgi:hypothetical protein
MRCLCGYNALRGRFQFVEGEWDDHPLLSAFWAISCPVKAYSKWRWMKYESFAQGVPIFRGDRRQSIAPAILLSGCCARGYCSSRLRVTRRVFDRYEWRENPEPERYGSAIHTGKPLTTTIAALEKCARSSHTENIHRMLAHHELSVV